MVFYLPRSPKPNVWLSDHDEDKINEGFWLRKLKNEQRSVKEVGKMLCPDQNNPSLQEWQRVCKMEKRWGDGFVRLGNWLRGKA
jgi:hypothetical protein